MHVQPLDLEDASLLATFVGDHPHGSVEQTWAWGELQCILRGRPAFRVFGLFDEEALVGSMLVVRQEMGFGKTWLWCPRGPLLPVEHEAEGWDQLRLACQNWAHLHGDVFLRVEPGLLEDGFDLGGWAAKEAYLPQHTLMLDLTLSEGDLLAQMTQKGRYNIRLAGRQGVVIEEGGPDDISFFHLLLRVTAVRNGFSVHEESYYAAFLSILGQAARFYLAKVEGQTVAGMLVTHFGGTATYYFGASDPVQKNLSHKREGMAPYLLQWHAILEARKCGLKRYDFLGVAPEGEAHHALSGVTQFKTRFGGKRVDYAEPRVFVYRRAWWGLYRLGKRLRC